MLLELLQLIDLLLELQVLLMKQLEWTSSSLFIIIKSQVYKNHETFPVYSYFGDEINKKS